MFRRSLCIALLFLSLVSVSHASTLIETFDINLDLPPQDRWTQVVHDYKAQALKVMHAIMDDIPKHILKEALVVADAVEHFFPRNLELRQEMEGIAKLVDIPVGVILAANLYYELYSGCTSIVGRHANGTFYHGRNLDYFIPGLDSITIGVRFMQKGKLVYEGTTFAGYTGLLTGMKPGAFSLSINQRDSENGHPWDNLLEAIFHGGRSVGFYFRSTLQNALDYNDALESLTHTPLIAPSYLIIAGTQAGEGAVISRDRSKPADVWLMDDTSTTAQRFLVQTNDDHWMPPMDDRREATYQHVNATCDPHSVSCECLRKVLSMPPTLNGMTIYTTVMSAGTGEYSSFLHNETSDRHILTSQ